MRKAMEGLSCYFALPKIAKWVMFTLDNVYFHEPASQLYKLHTKLDKLVMQIYGFSDSDDLLEKLLQLNQKIASQEKVSDQ
jgi:hypothetical protein